MPRRICAQQQQQLRFWVSQPNFGFCLHSSLQSPHQPQTQVSGGFNDLDNKINEILATVCSDVGVTKTATPTTTTVGQQVTYTITL
jgi:hypothetical protein